MNDTLPPASEPTPEATYTHDHNDAHDPVALLADLRAALTECRKAQDAAFDASRALSAAMVRLDAVLAQAGS